MRIQGRSESDDGILPWQYITSFNIYQPMTVGSRTSLAFRGVYVGPAAKGDASVGECKGSPGSR